MKVTPASAAPMHVVAAGLKGAAQAQEASVRKADLSPSVVLAFLVVPTHVSNASSAERCQALETGHTLVGVWGS
jgi:hypothetical protein